MIYKIYAPPLFRESFINADSEAHARRLFGEGLSESDKALIVAREVEETKLAVLAGRKG